MRNASFLTCIRPGMRSRVTLPLSPLTHSCILSERNQIYKLSSFLMKFARVICLCCFFSYILLHLLPHLRHRFQAPRATVHPRRGLSSGLHRRVGVSSHTGNHHIRLLPQFLSHSPGVSSIITMAVLSFHVVKTASSFLLALS